MLDGAVRLSGLNLGGAVLRVPVGRSATRRDVGWGRNQGGWEVLASRWGVENEGCWAMRADRCDVAVSRFEGRAEVAPVQDTVHDDSGASVVRAFRA